MISIECYIFNTNWNMNLQLSRTLALNLENCAESRPDRANVERSEIIFLVCLAVKQNCNSKQETLLFRDVIQDTNTRHEELK